MFAEASDSVLTPPSAHTRDTQLTTSGSLYPPSQEDPDDAGNICRFIDKDAFLESCERRSLYADRRENRIIWFHVTYIVPW